MTGAGSCLPSRKRHHDWLFRQGHSRLGGNGNMQNLHSCCLCCSLLVNQLSETADLAALTGPSIHKTLSSQINSVFRVKERPHHVFIYLICFHRHIGCCCCPLTACLVSLCVWVEPGQAVTGSRCPRAPLSTAPRFPSPLPHCQSSRLFVSSLRFLSVKEKN